jgi:hypothetical protein
MKRLVFGALLLAACSKPAPDSYWFADDESLPRRQFQVVVGETVSDDPRVVKLPGGKTVKEGDTIVYRYPTACGPRDIPMKVVKVTQEGNAKFGSVSVARVDPPAGKDEIAVDRVLLDNREGGDAKLQIGAATVKGAPSDGTEMKTTSAGRKPEWKGAWIGSVQGLDCAAEHEVKLNGTAIGKLSSKRAEILSPKPELADRDHWIFVTPKPNVCFTVRWRATERRNANGLAGEDRGVDDVLLAGAQAYWLPFTFYRFMAQPDEPDAPSGIFETPCPGAPESGSP